MIRQPREGTTVAEFFRQLIGGVRIIDGTEVVVSAAASTAVQAVRHGLGRAYRGAWPVVGPDQNVALRVLDPATQTEPQTYLYFQLSAATACNARVWVYLVPLLAWFGDRAC